MSRLVRYYTLFDELDRQQVRIEPHCAHCDAINSLRIDGIIQQAAAKRFYQGNVLSRDSCAGCYDIHSDLIKRESLWFQTQEQKLRWITGSETQFADLAEKEAERASIETVARIFANKIAAQLIAQQRQEPSSWFAAQWQEFNVARGHHATELHSCRPDTDWPQALQSRLFVEAFHESRFSWYSDESRDILRFPSCIAYDVQLPCVVIPSVERIAQLAQEKLAELLDQRLQEADDRYLRWKIQPVLHSSPFRHEAFHEDFKDWQPPLYQIGIKVLFWKSPFQRKIA